MDVIEKSKNCFGVECAGRRAYTESGSISGYMELKITCLNDLHIGDGSVNSVDNSFIKTVVKNNGVPVIPGSSLKGCVRAIAAAVSHSCLRDQKSKKIDSERPKKCSVYYNNEIKKMVKNICITCSLFGTMGYASKVDFSEFVPNPDKKVQLIALSKATPHSGKGEPEKRMFYRTRKENSNNKKMEPYDTEVQKIKTIKIEAVSKDTNFYGKIFFRNLTEEQLSLLMFSLGLDETVDLKIGGFKYDGMGKIKITVNKYKYNHDNTPVQLARNYEKLTDCKEQIKQIRNQNVPVQAIEGGDNGKKDT